MNSLAEAIVEDEELIGLVNFAHTSGTSAFKARAALILGAER